jgi:hypothetical protein
MLSKKIAKNVLRTLFYKLLLINFYRNHFMKYNIK